MDLLCIKGEKQHCLEMDGGSEYQGLSALPNVVNSAEKKEIFEGSDEKK